MKCPAEIYSASSRPYSGLPDLTYPLHDRDALVTACGRICDLEQKPWNPSKTPSAQGCHPCLRYVPLAMSPVRKPWSLREKDSNPRSRRPR